MSQPKKPYTETVRYLMRRLLSILLLATFALPLVAPLLALAQDSDVGLPACCRRHGQHHCTMLDAGRDKSVHRVVAVCAFYPQNQAAYLMGTHPPALQPTQKAWGFPKELTPAVCTETHRRIARNRSHCERGPPSDFPAIS
jgi:hypothetical protein